MNAKRPAAETLPDFQKITLKEKVHEYDDVYTFTFTPSKEVIYTPGDAIHLRADTMKEGSGRRAKKMSFASSPSDIDIVFSMRIRGDSAYKRALGLLEVGEETSMFKSNGSFHLPTDEKHVVMLAAGVGVTPFVSILSSLEQVEQDIKLIYVSGKDFLFQDILTNPVFNQQKVSRDEFRESLLETIEGGDDNFYMISGGEGFIRDSLAILQDAGIDESRFLLDQFTGYENWS